MTSRIQASVGQGGVNHHADVMTVQRLVNQHMGELTPLSDLAEDGDCGPLTVAAIREFQRRILHMRDADGRVDPTGLTLTRLASTQATASGHRVHFGHTVSDQHLHAVLQRIADVLGGDVKVTSGDRDVALKVGGKQKSLHLHHRAADFHVAGLTDTLTFQRLQDRAQTIFSADEAYELIHHPVHTETFGEHVHLGHYAAGAMTPGVYCKIEVPTRGKPSHYPTIRHIRLSP